MPVSQPYTAMSLPVSLPVIDGPQVTPIPMSGPTLGTTPFGGPHGNRRVSFGSVFDASSGQEQDNNGNNGNGGTMGSRTVQVQPQGAATFNLGIKPKDPPVFHGWANEDVSTWVAKVSDFFYLTEATPRQQVAYAATLLQDAAADWWIALLRERYGLRPNDFQEFAVMLEKRFGSSTRVDRARAALRDIRQGQSETVRAYSTRFEGLLGKLPSFDQDWAKTQFVWDLHSRVAELVTISGPADLHLAIRKAEEIEMARNLASGGQSGQKMQNQTRGRGRFQRGRGRFNAVQTVNPGQPQNVPIQQTQPFAIQSVQSTNTTGKVNAQCYNCGGYGHFYWECPSAPQAGQRGGRRGRGRWHYRGRRGRRGRRGGRRGGGQQGPQGNPAHAALIASGSDGPAPELQQVQVPPSVPGPTPSGARQGN